MKAYDDWIRDLGIEDVETTGGAVPRTEKQLKHLWKIYKEFEPERIRSKARMRRQLTSLRGK